MRRHQTTRAAATELRHQIELLVRPGRRSLVPGPLEDRLRQETGNGSGRIGKDLVTGPARLRQVTEAASGDPAERLLISVNQEGGRLDALDWAGVGQLPGNMALGAAGEEGLAELAGRAVGGQLRAVGLTWNLAPVCDLAGWPSSLAVGTRSFGDGPELVGRLAAGFVRGLQAAGVAATAKHFPGLGGVVEDPHHTVPVVEELVPGALLPFRAAVEAGVAAVMVGSHTVRVIDDRPALASPAMIRLLRDGLGFTGVIVSENLSIPAVNEPLGGLAQAAVAAVAAGVDAVMLDSEISRGGQPYPALVRAVARRAEVVEALVEAVGSSLISRRQVADAAGRVRALHDRFGLVSGAEPTTRLEWAEANTRAEAAAGRIGEASVTIVRGAHHLPLPADPGAPVVTVRVPDCGERKADSARHGPDLLPAVLAERHPTIIQRQPGGDLVPAGAATAVVYGYDTRDSLEAASGAAREAARLSGRGLRVVQVALGDVDDLAGSPADVLVAAFSPHRASLAAVADVLLGRGRPRGVLPFRGPLW
ncbi:glycoside hydrolase family 3 N-terminal domain-containing protein [Streptomyces sp. NPDC056672]|uniref:glycoside hydrolase family 3 N-terminal domain-containing protein n=1 Tax=Streptomyces sp. NPDC056672 TaxID=3345906 RepID=UPI00368A70D5